MENKLFISDRQKEALINYLSGNFSKSDSEILNAWLEKSTENQLLFDQFTDIWQASQYLKIKKNIDVHSAWYELQTQLHKKPDNQLLLRRWLQIAAIVIISLLAGGLGSYFLTQKQEPIIKSEMVEYVAPLGSRSFVKMPDGSKIWLNSGTTIQYKNSFGVNNRDIKLSGEAFFEVAKNKDLPFIVNTGDINVTALGTKFNVKAYKEEKTIETTLLEGSVKLESPAVKFKEAVVLRTNEKAVFTKEEQRIETIKNNDNFHKDENAATENKVAMQIIKSVDTSPIVSWKEKRWIISNEKLGALSVKLERRYDVNFIFDSEILKEYSFGGTLEDETLEQILKAISFAAPIKYIIDSKTVYIMADGKKMEKFKNLLME